MQAPTGFGKTITAAKIIDMAQAKGRKVLFTVPRLALVDQAILGSGGAMGWPVSWNFPIVAPVYIMGNFPYLDSLINLAEKLWKG